jgi:hypothetical protein
MKRVIIVLTVFFFLGTLVVSAQPTGKKWELGGGFSYTSYKFKGDTTSEWAYNFPLRVGYYVWQGLEFEPEFMLTKYKGEKAGTIFNLNVAYNFMSPGSIQPFILAGIGFGKGTPVANVAVPIDPFNAFLINLGGGVKCLIGNSAAVRFEIRYTHNHLTATDYVAENVSIINFIVGFSVFF